MQKGQSPPADQILAIDTGLVRLANIFNFRGLLGEGVALALEFVGVEILLAVSIDAETIEALFALSQSARLIHNNCITNSRDASFELL